MMNTKARLLCLAGAALLLLALGLLDREPDQASSLSPSQVASSGVPGTPEELDSTEVESLAPTADATPVERVEAAPILEAVPSLLTGVVLDPAGVGRAGARVGLLARGPEGPVMDPKPVSVRTEAGGRFALELPEWAFTREVIVIARHSGLRPATRFHRFDRTLPSPEWTLFLETGFSITGNVLRDGEGLVDLALSLDIRYGTPGVYGVGSEAFWIEGRLEEKTARVLTDGQGRFAFHGLGPYTHRVEFHLPGLRIPNHVVHQIPAPSEDFTIDLGEARLRVDVRGPAGSMEGADVRVSCERGQMNYRSGREPAVLRLPPGLEAAIVVRHPGARTVHRIVTTPPAGVEESVVLTLDTIVRPALAVRLPGAHAKGVGSLNVHLTEAASGRDTPLVLAREPGRDEFLADPLGVDPGDYSLVALVQGQDGYMKPSQAQVAVPAMGWVEVDLVLELGGRVEVQLDSPLAGSWDAHYRLVDAAGEECFSRSVSHFVAEVGPDEDFEVAFESSTSFFSISGSPGPAHGEGILEPGLYRLEVESGEHHTVSQDVRIEAGRTVRVPVDLRPVDADR